jgi:Ca-activated chloride channel homolog
LWGGIPFFDGALNKKISVAVVNNQGRFIPGIQQSNFRVLEDSVPQTIVDFRDTAPAVAILLECTTLLQQHMGEITGTAARLIDSLSPTDYVAVAEFDMRLKILTDFSSDRAIAHTALNQSQTCGFAESNLFDALKDLADRMKPIREKRKAIVVFTTGVDTFSRLSPDQARIAIRAAGVPIYAVRLHGVSRMETAQTDENLKALVADAGGQAFFPNSPDQYASALNSISDDLRGYEISFQRASQEEHPGTSNIRVELVNAQTGGPLRMTDPKGAEVPYRIIVTPIP